MVDTFSSAKRRYRTSERTQPCELCDHSTFVRIGTHDRRGDWLPTVACANCGLVSHEEIPTNEEVDKYYADAYRQDYHGEVQPAPHRVLRAWRGGEWLTQLLAPYLPTGGTICEVGSGIGCTVKVLEQAGYHASGIEPHRGFLEYSRTSIGASVRQQNLFDLEATPTFDFVLLVHVIEHFNSPRSALEHIHKLLTPNGQLYVECPNFTAPHAAPGKQFHFAHIYNFSPETLQNLAMSCGFETVASLAGVDEPTVRLVLRRTDRRHGVDTDGGFQRLERCLNRYNRLSYYLRPSYLRGRIARDVRFLQDRFLASVRVKQIVKPQNTSGESIARAA